MKTMAFNGPGAGPHAQRGGRTFRAGLAAATVCLLSGPATAGQGGSFRDDFEALDAERWYVSDGWANGEHQNCLWSKERVASAGGTLTLSYGRAPAGQERDYSCGEVQSRQRYGHGTYEARLKAVGRSGFNSAFFSYIGPADKEPHHEIDFEILGKDPSRVQLNQYVDAEGGNEAFSPVPGGAAADFHTYAFVWEPERLRYFVDGALVHEVNDPGAIPTEPMKIFASLWASETFRDWLGPFEAPEDVAAMEIDWIAYTAPGDACRFEGSITCDPK